MLPEPKGSVNVVSVFASLRKLTWTPNASTMVLNSQVPISSSTRLEVSYAGTGSFRPFDGLSLNISLWGLRHELIDGLQYFPTPYADGDLNLAIARSHADYCSVCVSGMRHPTVQH